MTEPADQADSLALTVCRLGLDPASGRLRHRGQLGVAIRGALFVELALDGRLAGERMPRPLGDSESGVRMPDAVHRALGGRALTPWKRWFSHTNADLKAATAELIRSGAWRAETKGRFFDNEAGFTLAQGERVDRYLSSTAVPAELDDAVVALLIGGAGLFGGKPRPRRQLSSVDLLLRPLLHEGLPQPETVRAAVRACLRAMRGRGRLPLSSR
jgi:hypothetical protein